MSRVQVPRQQSQGVGAGFEIEARQEVDAAALDGAPLGGEVDLDHLQDRSQDSAAGAQGVEAGLDSQEVPGLAFEEGRAVHAQTDEHVNLIVFPHYFPHHCPRPCPRRGWGGPGR